MEKEFLVSPLILGFQNVLDSVPEGTSGIGVTPMGRRDKYIPVVEKRLQRRFWPENLEDILDIGSCLLTVTPPFDEELLDYVCSNIGVW